MQDVFDPFGDFKLPEKVYIVGSGPLGIPHYRNIPRSAYIIALNAAVLARIPAPKIWMAFDPDTCRKPYFVRALQSGYRNAKRVFGREIMSHFKLECEYYFEHHPPINDPKDMKLIDCILRGGVTIFGCALQLAFHKGCRAVVCVGIDMQGNGYYDGSANLYQPGGPWMHVPIVDAMIRTMQAKRPDFRVYSLSPTALDIPVLEVADGG